VGYTFGHHHRHLKIEAYAGGCASVPRATGPTSVPCTPSIPTPRGRRPLPITWSGEIAGGSDRSAESTGEKEKVLAMVTVHSLSSIANADTHVLSCQLQSTNNHGVTTIVINAPNPIWNPPDEQPVTWVEWEGEKELRTVNAQVTDTSVVFRALAKNGDFADVSRWSAQPRRFLALLWPSSPYRILQYCIAWSAGADASLLRCQRYGLAALTRLSILPASAYVLFITGNAP
jgi:hypothetical protein